MRYSFNACLVTLLLMPRVALPAAEPSKPQTKPNIIIILADDLGYGDLGCYGATKIKTPNIDRLAAGGVRFTQGYAPSATCTPSRYSLLTGEYAWRQKAKTTSILDGDAPLCIEPGRFTLTAMLRQVGYQTGIVGKWHLGLGDGQTRVDFNGEVQPGPLETGFDYAHIIPATVDRVPSVWIDNHKVLTLDPADTIQVSYVTNLSDEPTGLERPDLLKQGADKQHSCTIINGISRIGYMKGGKSARFKDEELASTVVAKSVEFIEQHKDVPFFLEVGLFEPHVPRVAERPFVGTSECGVRGDVIQQIDWEVGVIMKALDRLHLANNTIDILSSDNGPILFDGYYDRSVEDLNGHQPTAGMRGWKYLTFEGGCRVPFIARWPQNLNRTAMSISSLITAGSVNIPCSPAPSSRRKSTPTTSNSMSTTLDDFSYALITNPDMIACNQNGVMGSLKFEKGGLATWRADKKGTAGEGWIGVFNRTDQETRFELTPEIHGLGGSGYKLADIWSNDVKALGRTITLQPHDVLFMKYKEKQEIMK